MDSSVTIERNNNVHFSPLEMVEANVVATSAGPMAKAWVMLTPKVLKIIIIVLASTVIVITCTVVVVVVVNVVREPTPTVSTTSSPASPTTTTSTTVITSPTSTTPETTSVNISTPSSTTSTTSTTTSSTTSSTTSTTSTTTSTTTTPTTTTTAADNTTTTSTTTPSTTTAEVCVNNEFRCGSGECITWGFICDGLPHCKDGSDEGADCVCGSDQWRCTSGQCVASSARCDQHFDCLDSSDETLCPDCSGYQCDSGVCLWDGSQSRCNGVFDCSDLSDEMGCSPRAGTMECANTVLVSQAHWCDGIDHCGDNSDEINCERGCPLSRVACPDGQCIQRSWVCDGYPDCVNGTDENNCGSCLPNQYMCDNYRCIEESAVCDGKMDCRMGEDETPCLSTESSDDTEDTGVLWVRYKGKDYAICSDVWTTTLAEHVCADLNQLHLAVYEAVKPTPDIKTFASLVNSDLGAKTTNIVVKESCETGHVINITCQRQECGERQVPFLQSFVAGGQIVPPGKWPWVVSLLHLGRAICAGTLIDNFWVVTAAHCILSATKGDYNFTSTPYYFDVIVGSTHKKGQSSIGVPSRVRVKKILFYPEMKVSVYGTVDWDVALLRLAVPVAFTDYVQPICLPHFMQDVPITSLCHLAGWGLTGPQQVVALDQLRDTRMQLWSETLCAKNIVPGETTVNTNSTLCGGFIFGRPSGCEGDSGGPLMCFSASGRWMLAGVMSRGSSPCGLYQPGIRANRFARVTSVVDWVKQQTTQS